MEYRGHLQETALRMLLLMGIVFSLLVTSSQAFTAYGMDRYSYMHTVAKKRGNRDLAIIQLYQLCDKDRNGQFSPLEFQCLEHILRLFIGVRDK